MRRRTGGGLRLAIGLVAFATAGLVVAGAGAGPSPTSKLSKAEQAAAASSDNPTLLFVAKAGATG